MTYTRLNQVDKVTESKSGTVVNSTSFTYNENSAPLTTSYDKQYSSYAYDALLIGGGSAALIFGGWAIFGGGAAAGTGGAAAGGVGAASRGLFELVG
ncbi:hypothetical protein ACLQ28_18515 [Micromonospora sp. DT201]|uniref:hypothetical protein n=1 Tax=Micromonospora sp. DT201 TaxID=3393442 RepID=UPI003CECD053